MLQSVKHDAWKAFKPDAPEILTPYVGSKRIWAGLD